MKRFALLTGILVMAAPLAFAQSSTWTADAAHSEVDFSLKHLSITTVRGHLGKVTATLVYNDKDISKSTVTATIDTTGVDSGQPARDTHIKSADFFDVATFPTATFTSTSFARTGNQLTVTGNLTLHGVTKPVVLTVDGPTAPVTGMDKKPHSGLEATTTISRTAFGIGSKFPDSVVSDAVKITIDLEIVMQ